MIIVHRNDEFVDETAPIAMEEYRRMLAFMETVSGVETGFIIVTPGHKTRLSELDSFVKYVDPSGQCSISDQRKKPHHQFVTSRINGRRKKGK